VSLLPVLPDVEEPLLPPKLPLELPDVPLPPLVPVPGVLVSVAAVLVFAVSCPRCCGSNTNCVMLTSISPRVVCRDTVTLTRYRLAAVVSLATSACQDHSGSSSKSPELAPDTLSTPEANSLSFDWHRRVARERHWTSSAWSVD
jgi:hypothetical protein